MRGSAQCEPVFLGGLGMDRLAWDGEAGLVKARGSAQLGSVEHAGLFQSVGYIFEPTVYFLSAFGPLKPCRGICLCSGQNEEGHFSDPGHLCRLPGSTTASDPSFEVEQRSKGLSGKASAMQSWPSLRGITKHLFLQDK